MKYIIKLCLTILFFFNIVEANETIHKTLTTGEEVFRAYCWGCHHQTAVAFGPSFEDIASKRTKVQIVTHIMAPKSDYKQLGYKRTVMPSFGDTLKSKELNLIADFVLSYKKGK